MALVGTLNCKDAENARIVFHASPPWKAPGRERAQRVKQDEPHRGGLRLRLPPAHTEVQLPVSRAEGHGAATRRSASLGVLCPPCSSRSQPSGKDEGESRWQRTSAPKAKEGGRSAPRITLRGPFPCAPRAQPGNSIARTVANKTSRNLIDSRKPFFSVQNKASGGSS